MCLLKETYHSSLELQVIRWSPSHPLHISVTWVHSHLILASLSVHLLIFLLLPVACFLSPRGFARHNLCLWLPLPASLSKPEPGCVHSQRTLCFLPMEIIFAAGRRCTYVLNRNVRHTAINTRKHSWSGQEGFTSLHCEWRFVHGGGPSWTSALEVQCKGLKKSVLVTRWVCLFSDCPV